MVKDIYVSIFVKILSEKNRENEISNYWKMIKYPVYSKLGPNPHFSIY